MPTDNDPYATPQVDLLDAHAPSLDGWSAAQLRMLGWLTLVSVLGSVVITVIALVYGFEEQAGLLTVNNWLSSALIILGCYLLICLKRFAEQRFLATRLDWPVWSVIIGSLVLGALDLLWGTKTAEVGWQMFSYFGLLSVYGVALAWLGIRLRQVQNAYPVFRLMAWLDIIGGLMLVSVILMVLAMLPLIGANLALALVFFRAAKELSRSGA